MDLEMNEVEHSGGWLGGGRPPATEDSMCIKRTSMSMAICIVV